jgi:unsaturated chondroitin disaccharide hydrolase
MTWWQDRALTEIVDRIGQTEAAIDRRFPVSADPGSGDWTTSGRGSWVGGFWVGQLWLRACLTGRGDHRESARQWVERLSGWVDADTVTRGLILWYGAASGDRLGVSDAGVSLARSGAGQLAATFEEASGVLPWGTAFGEPARPLLTRIDGVAGSVPLLTFDAPDRAAKSVAAQHVRTHLALHADRGGSAWSREEDGTWSVLAHPPPGWLRGEAWLLLALADAAHCVDRAFATPAHGMAGLCAEGYPAVRGRAGCPQDTSAAAITAVALCKLGRTGEATELVRTLVREHVTGGRLLDGCHDLDRGVATRHELVWGQYFLLLALAILTGEVSAHAV